MNSGQAGDGCHATSHCQTMKSGIIISNDFIKATLQLPFLQQKCVAFWPLPSFSSLPFRRPAVNTLHVSMTLSLLVKQTQSLNWREIYRRFWNKRVMRVWDMLLASSCSPWLAIFDGLSSLVGWTRCLRPFYRRKEGLKFFDHIGSSCFPLARLLGQFWCISYRRSIL